MSSNPKSIKNSKDSKDITNRYSKTGHGKLIFYCDACQKQCGDKLGYERHCQSTAHLERMEWIQNNSEQYLQENSDTFEKVYLDLLRLRGNNPVEMNVLYQDVIHDKNHVHLKSTKWAQLTDFVRYLDETNKCQVDFLAGKGWVLTYVEHDEKLLAKHRFANAKRSLMASAITSQQQEYIKLREGGSSSSYFTSDTVNPDSTPTAADAAAPQQQQPTDLSQFSMKSIKLSTKLKSKKNIFDDGDGDGDGDQDNHSTTDDEMNYQGNTINSKLSSSCSSLSTSHIAQDTYDGPKRKEISSSQQKQWKKRRKPSSPNDPWIRKGLFVKITNEALEGGKLNGMKGRVVDIFTSINKQLIPIDVSLRSQLISKLNTTHTSRHLNMAVEHEEAEAEDEDDDENVIFPHPVNPSQQVCIDYSLCIVAEISVEIENPEYTQKYIQNNKYKTDVHNDTSPLPPPTEFILKNYRLPQRQLQTTIPKEWEFDELKDAGNECIVGLVNGEYSDMNDDQPKLVKLLSLDDINYIATIQLIDESYKEIQFTESSLVSLSSTATANNNLTNSNNDESLYNTIVKVSYDDICKLGSG